MLRRLADNIREHWNPFLLPIAFVFATLAVVATLQTRPPDAPPVVSEESPSRPAVPSVPDVVAEALENQRASSHYIEITEGCGVDFGGACVNLRSGPSTNSPAVLKLRTGVVLKTSGVVENEEGRWFKVVFDEWLRYPERLPGEYYVSADYAEPFEDIGALDLDPSLAASPSKRIIVDRSDQKLYAYEGDTLFMEESISTGLELTPTPRGQFRVYRKTPSRYMQGPIPGISEKYFDLPGVPWNLYFTYEGAVIHGAYWHNQFGHPWSNGCVNLPPKKAKKLYRWTDLGTTVIVRD